MSESEEEQNSVEEQSSVEEIVPKELSYLFEKEIVEKQNKRIYLIENFIPTVINVVPMTLKFYSKYDTVAPLLKYLNIIEESMEGPSGRYKQPLVESHNYGWIPDAFARKKSALNFNRVTHPKVRSEITIFGENLVTSRITERPKFNGVRFYLR